VDAPAPYLTSEPPIAPTPIAFLGPVSESLTAEQAEAELTAILSDPSLNGEGLATRIATAAHRWEQLREMAVSRRYIGDAGLAILMDAFSKLRCLTRLCFSDVGMRVVGARAIAGALNCFPLLETLELDFNRFGDEGVVAMANALVSVPQLTALDMAGVGMTVTSASALSAALRHTPGLLNLSIYANPLGDEGAIVVAAALAHVPQLELLCLSHCSLSNGLFSKKLGILALKSAVTQWCRHCRLLADDQHIKPQVAK
jgi:Ran GTPase-activating protein (RanGAP) involved in mRNA processing and transport